MNLSKKSNSKLIERINEYPDLKIALQHYSEYVAIKEASGLGESTLRNLIVYAVIC